MPTHTYTDHKLSICPTDTYMCGHTSKLAGQLNRNVGRTKHDGIRATLFPRCSNTHDIHRPTSIYVLP